MGSLGTIADKYDVAISTACPALNNMVVDTVEQGQACIEYLRKQNIGRASFIVLDKLPANNPALGKIDTPENVPRLFDLIKLKEPRFAPAFFKGLGNTLVADNLEQANRIAYGQRRWRVVTLAGQLIDTSGTMSGGGTKVARGGMSSKFASDAVSPDVLRQFEKEAVDAEKELETFLAEKKAFESELDALKQKTPQVDIAISKIELDIQTAAKRMTEAEKRVKELKRVAFLSLLQIYLPAIIVGLKASRTTARSSVSHNSKPRLRPRRRKSTSSAKSRGKSKTKSRAYKTRFLKSVASVSGRRRRRWMGSER